MEQTGKKNWIAECILALLAYVVLFFLIQYTLVTAIFLAVPCIFFGARRGYLAGVAFFILCGATTFPLNEEMALVMLGVNLLPVVVGWYLIIQKRRAWESLVFSCGVLLVVAGAAVALLSKIAEGNVAQYLADLLLKRAQYDPATAATLFTMLISNDMASGVLSAQQAYELMYTADIWQYISAQSNIILLKRMIESLLPALIVYYIVYGGICKYFLSRLMVKKAGREVVKVPPIEAWRMPKQHGVYMVLTLAIGYLVMLTGNTALYTPAQMLFSIATIAFEIEGMSVVTYFLMLKIRSRLGRVAIAIVISLLAPGLMTAIGLIEQLFGIRKRFIIFKRK